MPTAAVVHPQPAAASGTTMSSIPPNQQPRPLRRAVYIHISDLTSAYNIDHPRLEEELTRAKAAQEKPPEEAAERHGVPTELDTSASNRRLQPPRAGYNLCLLVGKVNIVVDKDRVDGTRVRLAEVEVGDETGTVSLRARDEQIDTLKEVSERSGAIVLRNCTLELYQGKHLRLAVTKWGKLSQYPDQIASTPPPPSKLNRDRNFSLIDLSLVASEMVVPEDPYSQTSEAENQASSMMNSQQRYHSKPSFSRRQGRRGPTQHSGNKGGQGTAPRYDPGLSSPQVNYQPGSRIHGYGGMGGSPAYSFAPSPEQHKQAPHQPQHMMFHHQQQYEIQQHQRPYPSQPGQQLQTGALISPGLHPATSFEAAQYSNTPDYSHTQDASMNVQVSNPFLIPAQSQSTSSTPRRDSSSSSLESPRMNPQAATFDPNVRKY